LQEAGLAAAWSSRGMKKGRCIEMAKNTGDGYREGEVRDRSQVYNPATKKWTKRDAETGEFMDVKENGEPFKGIRKERE
jgi:hypothetical protein